MCFDCEREEVDRRSFLTGVAASAAGLALGGQAAGLQGAGRALDDPAIQHESVSFPNGADTIKGFLARPKAEGSYPPILLMQGNPDVPEWLQNTAARLAQAGYVSLVIDLGSRTEEP